MGISMATAANRFGLGARPGEIGRGGDGRDVLLAQLARAPAGEALHGLPDSAQTMQREYEQARAARAERAEAGPAAAMAPPGAVSRAAGEGRASPPARDDDRPSAQLRKRLREQQLAEFGARYRLAATTPTPFLERLAQFWSNHFAVSIDKGNARLYAASMEREAIRPHLLGRFQDMLAAVESHPAMLRYLDNTVSIGDRSPVALRAERLRRDKRGLNENLAREILELHTLGVDGGYGQDDVRELARAITGWSTPGPNEPAPLQRSFVFRNSAHEPGARRVLGRDYAEGGVEQGRAVLADLAQHPATARHLAFKLARHFVADQPPPALVQRMAQAYLRADGDLGALYRSLVESREAGAEDARKFKTPNDFVISALRAAELDPGEQARRLVDLLARLGQPVFTPRSPAGFADTAADWNSPDGLYKRIQAAQVFAARIGSGQFGVDRSAAGRRSAAAPQAGAEAAGTGAAQATPYQRAVAVLGDAAVRGDFAQSLRRAGSAVEGHALLFASPAFQWRI